MKFAALAMTALMLTLTACKPTPVIPTLPPIQDVPTSRPAAAIQNTEVMDESIANAAAGKT